MRSISNRENNSHVAQSGFGSERVVIKARDFNISITFGALKKHKLCLLLC